METMGDRLRAARSRANFTSATKAAEALGVSASTYRAHENGQNEFGPEEADRYARKFGTTAAYLLTGAGAEQATSKPRLVSSFDPDDDENHGNGYTREHWKPHTAGAIPELDVKLGAGNGTIGEVINLPVGDNSVSGHKVIREWLIPVDYLQDEIKASPRHSTIMEVIGDSMQPTYLPGDRVIVDLSQDTISADTVYAISYDDEPPQIKRLQKIPFSDPKQVDVISDNPLLKTFTVELDKLTIIGRICGHIARK